MKFFYIPAERVFLGNDDRGDVGAVAGDCGVRANNVALMQSGILRAVFENLILRDDRHLDVVVHVRVGRSWCFLQAAACFRPEPVPHFRERLI